MKSGELIEPLLRFPMTGDVKNEPAHDGGKDDDEQNFEGQVIAKRGFEGPDILIEIAPSDMGEIDERR